MNASMATGQRQVLEPLDRDQIGQDDGLLKLRRFGARLARPAIRDEECQRNLPHHHREPSVAEGMHAYVKHRLTQASL